MRARSRATGSTTPEALAEKSGAISAKGAVLATQGATGDTLHLILDGVFGVEVDGEQVAEMGPGTRVGERAALEGGVRTATLRALTPTRAAVIPVELGAEGEPATLAADRHREE